MKKYNSDTFYGDKPHEKKHKSKVVSKIIKLILVVQSLYLGVLFFMVVIFILMVACVFAPLTIKDLVTGVDINNSIYANKLKASSSGYGTSAKSSSGTIKLTDFEDGTKGYWYAKMAISTGLRPGFIEAVHMIETGGQESGGDTGSVLGPFQLSLPLWNGTGGGSYSPLGNLVIANDFNGDGKEDYENYVDAGYAFSEYSAEVENLLKDKWFSGETVGQHEQEAFMAMCWNSWYDTLESKGVVTEYHQAVKDLGGDSVLASQPMSKDDGWGKGLSCPSSLDIGPKDAYAVGYYGYAAANFAEYYNQKFYTTYSIGNKDWSSTGGSASSTSSTVQAAMDWALDKCGKWQYNQSRRMEEGYADCSSFVYRAYLAAGVDLLTYGATGTSTVGECTAGTEISFDSSVSLGSQVQPGDLIFCNSEGQNSHVVMAIGDNKYVAASSASKPIETQICTGELDYYQDKVYCIRRIVTS